LKKVEINLLKNRELAKYLKKLLDKLKLYVILEMFES